MKLPRLIILLYFAMIKLGLERKVLVRQDDGPLSGLRTDNHAKESAAPEIFNKRLSSPHLDFFYKSENISKMTG